MLAFGPDQRKRSVMKTEMEKTESRELADAELDVVSAGGWFGGLVAGAVGGVLGVAVYSSGITVVQAPTVVVGTK
jgi:hypothetical protein